MKRSPIKKVNRERQKKRASQGIKGEYHQWIKTKPCILLFRGNHVCFGVVDGHHILHTQRGGVDYENEVSVCRGGHTELHSSTALDIELRYGLSKLGLELEAKRLAKEWDKKEKA